MSLDLSILNSYREYMGEDADTFIQEIIDAFCTGAPLLLDTLEKSLAKDDAEAFVRAAHTLKSNCATVGATELTALCAGMEQEGKVGDIQNLGDKVSQARDELTRVLALLKKQG
ncbi:MAG: Hpt domain-containing protein [Chloroflexota bacterium]